MDKGKWFLLIVIIIVAVIFLSGVLYIISSFVFKSSKKETISDPHVKYTNISTEKIQFEKIEESSEINYNFKIES